MITRLDCPPCTEFLDNTCLALADGDVRYAMGALRTSLHELRSQLPPGDWQAIGMEARRHPLHRLLLESPFTRRAYDKPRGYAGDAVLMDLIYGLAPARGHLSPLGGMLYGYEFDSPCFQSVRTRRAVLAREIDAVAARRPGAHVLAVASGHLREIEWSRAARSGVATMRASIGDLLRRSRLKEIDLAYAAGLYDYLDEDLARLLTTALFRKLASGGRVLIANFTPATYDAAFMETFMDWRLVYRTPAQVRALASSIPAADVAGIDQFSDENHHVTYMRVIKR